MGRLIPKTNPKYDRAIDINVLIPASRAQAADAMMAGLNVKNIEVEERTANQMVLTGKSAVGMKNIWITVDFVDAPGGLRVTSKITKAHTAAWIYLFHIGFGPRRVRGLSTYKTLSRVWGENLGALGATSAAGAP